MKPYKDPPDVRPWGNVQASKEDITRLVSNLDTADCCTLAIILQTHFNADDVEEALQILQASQ